MKFNTNFPTMDEILGVMRKAESGSVKNLSRVETPEEQAEAAEAMQRIVQNAQNVKFLCGACGMQGAMVDAQPCVCNQFICAACAALEEDGVCNHERPGNLESQVEAVEEAEGGRRTRDEAQRDITLSIGKWFDGIGVPNDVRINIAMSLVVNALLRIAGANVAKAQTLAMQLGTSLIALSQAPTPEEMAMEVEKFARHVPAASEAKPS